MPVHFSGHQPVPALRGVLGQHGPAADQDVDATDHLRPGRQEGLQAQLRPGGGEPNYSYFVFSFFI